MLLTLDLPLDPVNANWFLTALLITRADLDDPVRYATVMRVPSHVVFRFVDGPPDEVLRLAQEAAGGRDVRIGGGPSAVRQFLQAGLVDFMHLVIVPITLGRGVSLWEGSSGLEDRFTIEAVKEITPCRTPRSTSPSRSSKGERVKG